MSHTNCYCLPLLFLFGISFPFPFFHHKNDSKIVPLRQIFSVGTAKCRPNDDDNLFGTLLVGNWAFVNGVNGQLNGFGGVGTFCSDFEPDCGGFRRYCFLQSIAEACLWSCGICGGFGGIGGGGIGGPFGKK